MVGKINVQLNNFEFIFISFGNEINVPVLYIYKY